MNNDGNYLNHSAPTFVLVSEQHIEGHKMYPILTGAQKYYLSMFVLLAIIKHRHAKRARVIFLVIGVFVELFTVMVRLSFFGLRCTARRKLEIYNL